MLEELGTTSTLITGVMVVNQETENFFDKNVGLSAQFRHLLEQDMILL